MLQYRRIKYWWGGDEEVNQIFETFEVFRSKQLETLNVISKQLKSALFNDYNDTRWFKDLIKYIDEIKQYLQENTDIKQYMLNNLKGVYIRDISTLPNMLRSNNIILNDGQIRIIEVLAKLLAEITRQMSLEFNKDKIPCDTVKDIDIQGTIFDLLKCNENTDFFDNNIDYQRYYNLDNEQQRKYDEEIYDEKIFDLVNEIE